MFINKNLNVMCECSVRELHAYYLYLRLVILNDVKLKKKKKTAGCQTVDD